MPQDQDDIKGADAMKQAPTPGPLTADDVKLLVKGDLLQSIGQCAVVRFECAGNSPGYIRHSEGHGPFRYFAFIGRPDAGPSSIGAGLEPPSGYPSYDAPQDPARTKAPTAPVEASGWEPSLEANIGWFVGRARKDGFHAQADWLERQIAALHPQPSWSEEVQTADTTHSRRLFFGDPGSPQPSGETREQQIAAVMTALNSFHVLSGRVTSIQAEHVLASLAALRPAPVASGGQHSSGEAAGCAESEVGRAVYKRIEKLLKTDPTGWERAYLCHLVESVEEVGGYDGPRLDSFPYRKAVAAFLKLRDDSVGPGEADDEERLESADIILSLTAPVAETAGEAEYASGCGYTGHEFGASYPDSTCIDGYLWDLDSCEDEGGGLTHGGDIPCPKCNPEQAATIPVPAQDDDKLRIAVEALEKISRRTSIVFGRGIMSENEAFGIATEAIAALKAEGK